MFLELGGGPMKFKRDWPIILRDIVFTILFISTLVTCIVLIPLFRSGQLGFFEVFLLLSFCGIIVLTYYFAGVFSNIIILNENGITLLQRKKTPVTLSWNSIIKISRTRYIGGKALVFEDTTGQKVWIYPTKKIEDYFHQNHPELNQLFPDKNTFTRWAEIIPW